jgi:hypothetical protein
MTVAAAEPAAARCGARTRDGGVCERASTPGKRRCRSHGGAPGSGARKGNRNAETDGLRTREAMVERREVAALLREGWRMVKEMEQGATPERGANREGRFTTEGAEDTERLKPHKTDLDFQSTDRPPIRE